MPHPAVTRALTDHQAVLPDGYHVNYTDDTGPAAPSGREQAELLAAQAIAYYAHKVPVLGEALDVVSTPFRLAGAPDLATLGATALVGGVDALVTGVAAWFDGGPPMIYTEAGGRELARKVKASMDLDAKGRATTGKWMGPASDRSGLP